MWDKLFTRGTLQEALGSAVFLAVLYMGFRWFLSHEPSPEELAKTEAERLQYRMQHRETTTQEEGHAYISGIGKTLWDKIYNADNLKEWTKGQKANRFPITIPSVVSPTEMAVFPLGNDRKPVRHQIAHKNLDRSGFKGNRDAECLRIMVRTDFLGTKFTDVKKYLIPGLFPPVNLQEQGLGEVNVVACLRSGHDPIVVALDVEGAPIETVEELTTLAVDQQAPKRPDSSPVAARNSHKPK